LKVAEAHKSTAAKSQVQAKQEPFFKKEGDSDFFSKSNEASQFFSPTTIQPKLKIGKPNDKYEVEADSMADKVVQRLNNPSSQETTVSDSKTSTAVQAKHSPSKQEEKLQKKEDEFSETDTGLQQKAIFESNAEQLDTDVQTKPLIPFIQAKCATCEQEERVQKKEDELSEAGEELQTMAMAGGTATPPDGENIQTKSEGSSTQASSDLQSRLNSSRGGGSPLSSDMQSSMGAAMGADFSNVRVHTGSEAEAMNKDLNAQAFTHGSDIYFNEGKYDTNSDSGKHLLAHELTHTVQQGKSVRKKVQKKVSVSKTAPRIQRFSLWDAARRVGRGISRGARAVGRGVVSGARAVGRGVSNLAQSALDMGRDALMAAVRRIAPDFARLIERDGIRSFLRNLISRAFRSLFNGVSTPIRSALRMFSGLRQRITGGLSSMRAFIGGAASNTFAMVRTAATSVGSFISGVVTPVFGGIRNVAGRVKNFFTGIRDVIGVPIKAVYGKTLLDLSNALGTYLMR